MYIPETNLEVNKVDLYKSFNKNYALQGSK